MSTETVYFTRYFTRGNLAGIYHHDRITFVSPERALTWAHTVAQMGIEGQLDYELTDYTFQARRCDA